MANENSAPNIPADKLPAVFDAYRENSSKRQAELSLQIEDTIQRLNVALKLIDGGQVSGAREVIAAQLKALQKKVYEEKIATWEKAIKSFGEKDQAAFSEQEKVEFAELQAYLVSIKDELAAVVQQENSHGANAA